MIYELQLEPVSSQWSGPSITQADRQTNRHILCTARQQISQLSQNFLTKSEKFLCSTLSDPVNYYTGPTNKVMNIQPILELSRIEAQKLFFKSVCFLKYQQKGKMSVPGGDNENISSLWQESFSLSAFVLHIHILWIKSGCISVWTCEMSPEAL